LRRLAQFDLNLLETFEAIYSEGGVSRAARHLNLSQPAVSHGLARLREAFNDELFVREGNRLVPTAMAREIVGPIREALRNFGFAITSAMTFDPATANRLFRIGMRLSGEAPNFASLVTGIREIAPSVRLSSAHFPRQEMPQLLADGRLDLAIDVAHTERAGLNRELLRQDQFVVAARKGHPDIDGAISLETYLAQEHVFASPRSTGLGHEDAALAKLGKERAIAVRCQNAMSAWQIVSRTDMILTLSRRYADTFQGFEDLQVLPLPLEIPLAEAFMYWHEASESDPGLIWLREQIRNGMMAQS
tara:strand:+ start:31343 stop:32254 length:912 start_codon:yes stop_codon:yes gene_type:complete